jgi:hypothetical protein
MVSPAASTAALHRIDFTGNSLLTGGLAGPLIRGQASGSLRDLALSVGQSAP